jgi:hypothetical protein
VYILKTYLVIMVDQLLRRSRRQCGLSPEKEDQPTAKRQEVSLFGNDIEPLESKRQFLDLGGIEHVEVEVVDEIPPPNLNPPLTNPFGPILLEIGRNLSDSFSFFNSHNMVGVNGSSSMPESVSCT